MNKQVAYGPQLREREHLIDILSLSCGQNHAVIRSAYYLLRLSSPPGLLGRAAEENICLHQLLLDRKQQRPIISALGFKKEVPVDCERRNRNKLADDFFGGGGGWWVFYHLKKAS